MQSVTYYFNNNSSKNNLNNSISFIFNNKLRKIKKYFDIKPIIEDFIDEIDDWCDIIFD